MISSRVHILGAGGNISNLLAHSLRTNHPALPITLLFRSAQRRETFKQVGHAIEVVRHGKSDQRSGFDTEVEGTAPGRIYNLIVGTKAVNVVEAMSPLVARLGRDSTVLFVQNGMGTINEVTSALFPDAATRPSFLVGILNHGVKRNATELREGFSIVHAGIANAFIGPMHPTTDPSRTPSHPVPESASSTVLADSLAACPELAVSVVNEEEIMLVQLQKLSVNAVINPLTAIFGIRNGALFESTSIKALMKQLIQEISCVLLAYVQSQTNQFIVPHDIRDRLSVARLTANLYEVGEKTKANFSSMYADFTNSRPTEIDYINGWIVQEGKRLGVQCPINKRLVKLIKGNTKASTGDVDKVFGSFLRTKTRAGLSAQRAPPRDSHRTLLRRNRKAPKESI